MITTSETNYEGWLESELDNIGKLSETPEMIRELALAGINAVLKNKYLQLAVKTKLENAVQSLTNISQTSIKNNYKIIHNQMCILAVSSLEAILKNYFCSKVNELTRLNLENKKLLDIKITAVDLIRHKLHYEGDFGDLILNKGDVNFQNLKLIKLALKDYFNIELSLSSDVEKQLVYYFEIRHVLVHKSSIVDKYFIASTKVMSANIGGYKISDKVELGATDWKIMSKAFITLVAEITKN